jgi:hypothetical protein
MHFGDRHVHARRPDHGGMRIERANARRELAADVGRVVLALALALALALLALLATFYG